MHGRAQVSLRALPQHAINFGPDLSEVRLERLRVLELAVRHRLADKGLEERLLLQQRLQRLGEVRIWVHTWRLGRRCRRCCITLLWLRERLRST